MDTNKGCMKKVLLTLALMLGAFTATFAQSTKDVLYLKNGSIIYGQLIEMVPEKQVKIKTADGSVFVYNTSEVDRIAKAEKEVKEQRSERKSSFRTRKIATGFKGFIDDSYSASMNGSDFNRGGLSVSLGSQILPQLFVGAGLGLEYYTEPEVLTVPVFADVRVNFINGPVSPFLGVKVGSKVSILTPWLVAVSVLPTSWPCTPPLATPYKTRTIRTRSAVTAHTMAQQHSDEVFLPSRQLRYSLALSSKQKRDKAHYTSCLMGFIAKENKETDTTFKQTRHEESITNFDTDACCICNNLCTNSERCGLS